SHAQGFQFQAGLVALMSRNSRGAARDYHFRLRKFEIGIVHRLVLEILQPTSEPSNFICGIPVPIGRPDPVNTVLPPKPFKNFLPNPVAVTSRSTGVIGRSV